MLWEYGFLLMALVYPIFFIALIYFADKDPQIEPDQVIRETS